MDLVDDDDLIPSLQRLVLDALPELPDLVDSPVRGAVDLKDIRKTARRDLKAVLTAVAGLLPGTLKAVEGFGEKTGQRGFSHAPHPGEEVTGVDLSAPQGVLENRDNVVLVNHLREELRTMFPGDREIAFLFCRHGEQNGNRHTVRIAYRCFLSDLTRFARLHCRPRSRIITER